MYWNFHYQNTNRNPERVGNQLDSMESGRKRYQKISRDFISKSDWDTPNPHLVTKIHRDDFVVV